MDAGDCVDNRRRETFNRRPSYVSLRDKQTEGTEILPRQHFSFLFAKSVEEAWASRFSVFLQVSPWRARWE